LVAREVKNSQLGALWEAAQRVKTCRGGREREEGRREREVGRREREERSGAITLT